MVKDVGRMSTQTVRMREEDDCRIGEMNSGDGSVEAIIRRESEVC